MDPQFEAVELEGDTVIKTFPVHCALLQDNHSWHYHPECELTYIIKGEGTRFIGDNVQHFGPGDLIFCGPNLPHCWINDDKNSDDPARNQLLVLQFKPDCLGTEFLESPDAKPLKQLIKTGQRGMNISGQGADNIVAALQELQKSAGMSRLTSFVH